MKTLFVLLSLLTTTAFAAPEVPPPDAGTYAYLGNFEVKMKLHYEVVYAFADGGQARLEKLRKEKYECWNKGRETWLCKQFQSTEGSADVIRSRVETALSGKTLELGERFGEPSLISKGEDVAEYRVLQKATYGGKSWDDYRLFMSRGDWSIRMGEPTEAQFALNNGTLSKWEQVSVTDSKTAYTIYLVEAAFPKAMSSVLVADRMFICKVPFDANRASFFFSIDPTGTRMTDFRYKGEKDETYSVSDVVQFRYSAVGNQNSFYAWYLPKGAMTGFSIEFSGVGNAPGTYKQLVITPTGPSTELTSPLTCSRII